MLDWLKNLKVGSKIGLGFATFSFIFFFNIDLTLNFFNQTDVLSDRIAELRAPTAKNSLMLLNGINHSLAALRGWLLMGDEQFKKQRQHAWSREIELPLETLNILSKRWTNPENNVRLKEITAKLKNLKQQEEKIENLPRTSGWAEANRILSEEATPTARAITTLAEKMAANQQELLLIDLRESRKISDRGHELLLATLLVSVFFGFLVAIPITISITRPLKRITEFSKKIASGDLQQESVPKVGKDEIGILTDNLNQMVFGLLSNLKEKEARNFAILYNIVDPLIEIDDRGFISTFNPAAVRVFGYSASEVIGKNVKILMPDPYQREHDQYLEKYEQTGDAKIIGIGRELVGKRKDGSLFPMDLSVNEFMVKGQRRYVGICRDITERKQAQEKIEKANRNLEKQNRLIAQVSELNDSMRGDQDGIELAQNVVNLLARYLKARVGVIYIIESDRLKVAAGFGIEQQDNYLQEFMVGEGLVGKVAMEKKRIVINDVAEDHVGIASGLGDVLPGSLMIIPLLHENVVIGVMEFGFTESIGDLQTKLVDQTEDGIAIALNSALARKQMRHLLSESQAQAEELAAQKEELEQIQEELQQSNQFLEKQAASLAQQKREIEEKTKLVKSKVQELEAAGRYKSEFLANMSHELRTPLNSLLILSQLLSENKDKNLSEKQIEFAKTIHSSGSDLLGLINDILDLSKVEAGKMELQLENVKISDLAESLKRMFKPIAQQQNLDFEIEISEQIPNTIQTDGQRVEQVIKNFLSNAFKFTEEGKITLKFHAVETGTHFVQEPLKSHGVVGISVSDTGKGISQDKQGLIFEAFQQEDGTTSRKFGGTGLGLSISRELTRLLAGEIHIKSEEGSGSTFTMYIPEKHPALDVQTGREQSGEVPDKYPLTSHEEPGPLSILIIEDDPIFSKFVSEVARQNSIESIVAGDGELGLELAKNNPAAIILDMTLPGINGLEVMKKIKGDSQTRDIPVYFISAQYEKADDALQLGAVDFIKKPVDYNVLKEVFAKIGQRAAKTAKQILVVEDNEDMRDSMVSILSSAAINVLTAETTDDALTKLRNHHFDCMTVDLGLNGKSGFDLLHEIKNDKMLANIPIIIHTGRKLTLSQEEELDCFTKTVIIKGAKSPDRLLDEINLFLNRPDQRFHEDEKTEVLDNHQEDNNPPAVQSTETERDSTDLLNPLFQDKKILLADDDMRNVFALTHLLEENNINVVVARNGKEAIDVLKSNPDTDLVLMDIMMPEMDGYTAIQEIRKDESLSEIPIIAITAKAMKNDNKKCLDAGANDYLTKPIDQGELFTQMSSWFEKNRKMNGSTENEQ